MRTEPDEERLARHLMSKAMGIPVESHDDGRIPAQYDFKFSLSDGRSGAAEMTTITDPGDRQWLDYRRYTPTVPDSRWAWHVRRRGQDGVTLSLLIEHLRVLAPLAERYDETDVCALAHDRPELISNESAQWLRSTDIDISGVRGHSEPGAVFFSGDSSWAMIGDTPSLDPLLKWLEAALATERFNGDFSKISSSGCDEQHLVLRIDLGNAIPDEHTLRLIDPNTTLPTRSPYVPGRKFTGLWLMPEFGTWFSFWTADEGWRRFHVQS